MNSQMTYDNLPVTDDYVLKFIPICFGKFKLSNPLFFFEREYNTNYEGKKKIYYILYLLGFHFTGGWLFDTRSV